jgi:trigger factor
MKKRYLFLAIGLCFLVLAGGCKKRNPLDDQTPGNTADNGTEAEQAPVREEYKASDYVTLGQYKGVKVTVERIKVTDGIVDMAINDHLKTNATVEEVTDRAVKSGDTVNIDYEGLKDGVAFEGGTAKGFDLVIGSGQFIPGFEDGLIGANIGDKLSLDITFPQDYKNSPELAGQPVVFNVTINSISESKIPELTEDYVKENTEYESIQAFKDATRVQLQDISDQNFENAKMNNVLQAIVESSTYSSVPQSLLDYYAYSYRKYNEQMAQYNFGASLDDYLAYVNMTKEDFEKVVSKVAEGQAKAEIAEKAIADAEDIKISEAEYKELLPKYMSDRGVDTEENLLKYETKKQTKENMRMQKALDLIVGSAEVTEKITDETTDDAAVEDIITEEAGADNAAGE